MNNEKNNNGLYIQLYSIHGLIRGTNLELGRDADTGGQTKYVLELAETLSRDPRVEKIELVTRQIKDKKVSDDYSVPEEKVNDKFSIVRMRCGGGKYIRKELLWNHLEEFVDKSIKYIISAPFITFKIIPININYFIFYIVARDVLIIIYPSF